MTTLGLQLEWGSAPDGVRLDGKTFKPRTPREFPYRLDIEDLADPLAVQFINATTDEEREAFLAKYGWPDGGGKYLRADMLRDQAELKKRLKLAGSESSEEVGKAFKGLEEHRPTLYPDLNGRRLVLMVMTLRDLMFMEVALVAQNDVRFATCLQCGTAFLTGPLTKRRSHAVFCSPRCRMAYTRAQQAQEG